MASSVECTRPQCTVQASHWRRGKCATSNSVQSNEVSQAGENMPKPTVVNSLQRLLGMIKYLAQYIPNESAITEPLRELLKKDAEWAWHPEHDKAIENLKAAFTNKPVLAFFYVKQPVTIQADASQSGLGACLMQRGKPVAYASRAMTRAEQNYA